MVVDSRWWSLAISSRVCTRSGNHPYNTSLFAAMIVKHGVEDTATYLTDLKANLARRAAGGDREVARDILAGTPGCRSVRMTRGIESAERFVLLVEWDDVEAHLRNFRETDRFTRWRAAIGPWFAGPPRIEHFTDVS